MAEVAGLEQAALVAILGGASGRHIHALAHNRDPRPVETTRRRRSVGAQHALGWRRSTPADIDATLISLVDRVARRLRAAGRVGRTVTLRFRFEDSSRATRSHTLIEPTQTTQDLLRPAQGLLAAAQPLIAAEGLTLLGVTVSNLDDDRAVQLALPLDRRHDPRFETAMDAVRDRFGAASLTRSVLVGHSTGAAVPMLPD